MIPFRSSFIKIPKHKQFSYKPRYFDPEAEDRKPNSGPTAGAVIQGSFSAQWKQKQKATRASAGRVMIFFILLLLVVYLILR